MGLCSIVFISFFLSFFFFNRILIDLSLAVLIFYKEIIKLLAFVSFAMTRERETEKERKYRDRQTERE